ncbi:MAG: chloride channel protein [Candidatus Brocadiales bacterium]
MNFISKDHLREYEKRFAEIVLQLKAYGPTFMVMVAALIGVLVGLAAVSLRQLITLSNDYIFLDIGDSFPHAGMHNVSDFLEGFTATTLLVLLIPGAGLVIAAFLANRYATEAKGHGVPEVMSAMARKAGVMRPRVAIVKTVVSAICIGSGGSVGQVGPSVQVGSVLASTVGQVLKMSENSTKTLVACGAAAGLAAVFNAPITGTIFASEVILGNLGLNNITPVLISSVVGSAMARIFIGDDPAFFVPAFTLESPWELILYCMLGICAGVLATGFTKALYTLDDVFKSINVHYMTKAVIGGAILGIVGIFLPQLFGLGFGTLDKLLYNTSSFSIFLIITLCLMKIILTSVTLAAGGSGGIYGPSLFIGAFMGSAFGLVFHHIAPFEMASAEAYGVVGMSGFLAGATHAPIQAIFITFELTGDYHEVIPIMLTSVLSTLAARRLLKDSIYTLKSKRRGERIEVGQDLSLLERVQVADIMEKDFSHVTRESSFIKMLRTLYKSRTDIVPVLDEKGEFYGIVSFHQVRKAIYDKGPQELLVADDVTLRDPLTVTPSANLADVFTELGMLDINSLPVVSDENPKKLVGIVTRSSIISRYRKEIIREDEVEHGYSFFRTPINNSNKNED